MDSQAIGEEKKTPFGERKPMKYFVVIKSSGCRLEIDPNPQAQKEFFRIIETVTGLDRKIAEALLDHGKPIDHPGYFFSREEGE